MEKKMDSNLGNNQKKVSTKQKIINCAIHLFAIKGYTETTIREIATQVGVTEASIYNHFPSKNAILEYILEEFALFISKGFYLQEKLSELKENPTAECILSCVIFAFPEDNEEYYQEELCVLLQEQYRNPTVRKFVAMDSILSTEENFKDIIDKLKEFNILRSDTDPDFWVKMYSSLLYTFTSRFLLGIGDSSPGFTGMTMREMILNMCDLMLKMHGTSTALSMNSGS
jgi:AcrR family transcriptional regulator